MDSRGVSYCFLQNIEEHRVVGLQQHINLKNGAIECRFPIRCRSWGNFVSDRVRFLHESPESTSVVTETSYEMQTEEPKARSCTECSETFQDFKKVAASFLVKTQQKKNFTLLIMRLSYPRED